MGFRCIYCGTDFNNDKDAMTAHINTVHKNERLNIIPQNDVFLNALYKVREEYGASPPKKKTRKKSVDLMAFKEAVEDGRLEIWMDGNGTVNIENVHSGKSISVFPTKDMNGEKDE